MVGWCWWDIFGGSGGVDKGNGNTMGVSGIKIVDFGGKEWVKRMIKMTIQTTSM